MTRWPPGWSPRRQVWLVQHVDADTDQRVVDGITAQARSHEDPATGIDLTKPDIVRPFQREQPAMRSIASATATPAISGSVDSRWPQPAAAE